MVGGHAGGHLQEAQEPSAGMAVCQGSPGENIANSTCNRESIVLSVLYV